MKKLFVLCLGFMLILGSCDKESSIIPVKMSAKIDGDLWNSIAQVSVLAGDVFTITGSSATDIIIITINGTTTGTYNLALLPTPAAECACTYKPSLLAGESDWFLSVTGKVVLTKVDKTNKKISGTYEFSVSNKSVNIKTISSGQFNDLSYTEAVQ